MTHEMAHPKSDSNGFRSGHFSTGNHVLNDFSDSPSATGVVFPLPGKANPRIAAQVMAHYADGVHPVPHSRLQPSGSTGDAAHRVGDAGDEKHILPPVHTGLGDRIDRMVAKSPTLLRNLSELQRQEWGFEYGLKGAGSFSKRGKKPAIILDAIKRRDPLSLLMTLAHESGHAMYRLPAPVLMDDHVNREQYIQRNTERCLQDEGEATITNLMVREELLKAKVGDIGVSGAKATEYQRLFRKYHDATDHDRLRAEIAKVYAKGEHPSTDPTVTYEQFCAKPFAAGWDRSHPIEPTR